MFSLRANDEYYEQKTKWEGKKCATAHIMSNHFPCEPFTKLLMCENHNKQRNVSASINELQHFSPSLSFFVFLFFFLSLHFFFLFRRKTLTLATSQLLWWFSIYNGSIWINVLRQNEKVNNNNKKRNAKIPKYK